MKEEKQSLVNSLNRCSSHYMNMEHKINLLFEKLLSLTPIAIKDKMIFYNLNGVDMSITFFYNSKYNTDESFKYTFYNPFDLKHHDFGHHLCWDISSPDGTGNIHAIINTPYKQYRVRRWNEDEQYFYKKKFREIFKKYEYEYLNQFIDEFPIENND